MRLRNVGGIVNRIGFLLAIIVGTSAAAVAQAKDADRPFASIAIANPEDLAPVDGDRVIVSAMDGWGRRSGALVLVDRRTGAVTKLRQHRSARARTSDGCDGPVPEALFKPHGIALTRDGAGRRGLYVVNHGARESIEFFRFESAPRPRLVWEGCAVFPPGAFGNSVAVARDRALFVTNQGRQLDGAAPITPFGGEVLSWRPKTGWSRGPGRRVAGANGLLLSPDEATLYVAAWTDRAVVAVPIAPGGGAGRIPLPFLPDNLRWSDSGAIFATGHLTSTDEVARCFMAPQGGCTIASAIAELDPVALRTVCARKAPTSMATSVVGMGRELWIGSARSSHLDRIEGPLCPADDRDRL
jgi:hypothetical protein